MNRPIGEALQAKGLITGEQLRVARFEQRGRREPLARTLVALGFVKEAAVRETLGELLAQESVDLAAALPDREALRHVPVDLARRHTLLPLAFDREAGRLLLAMADPLDVVAVDQIRARLGRQIDLDLRLAGESEIGAAIDRFYGFELSIDGILQELESGDGERGPSAGGNEYHHPMVRLVDALISEAVEQGASDIHLEPEQGFLRIRYRVDGVLHTVHTLHGRHAPAVGVRLKVMADMNIAESRAPQDGAIHLSLQGRPVDLRVAAFPTLHGENIVLRILDRFRGIVPLERLGLGDHPLRTLRLMMARPEGILLVTGPTGSGKTTTLYSMLNELNSEQVNIVTLEDPVEYPIAGLRQTSVNEGARLDFAAGVRALLRQDPDILLIGEIRDAETAGMALRAAMTGHQVYATLHAASALGAIPRLLDIGLTPEALAGNLIGVVGQRLVRRLCRHCRRPYTPGERERRLLGLPEEYATLWRAGEGCEACRHRGYAGRLALMEVLKMDGELDELIARRAPPGELLRRAGDRGFRSLAEEGMQRVLEGDTSLDELARVVDLTARAG